MAEKSKNLRPQLLTPGFLYKNRYTPDRFDTNIEFVNLDVEQAVYISSLPQIASSFGVWPKGNKRVLYLLADVVGYMISVPKLGSRNQKRWVSIDEFIEAFGIDNFARYEAVVLVADKVAVDNGRGSSILHDISRELAAQNSYGIRIVGASASVHYSPRHDGEGQDFTLASFGPEMFSFVTTNRNADLVQGSHKPPAVPPSGNRNMAWNTIRHSGIVSRGFSL